MTLKRFLLAAALSCGACLLPFLTRAHAAEQTDMPYVAQFTATVREGPDAGLMLQGELRFRLDDRRFISGVLVEPDSTRVPFAGQTDGRSIEVVFTPSDDQVIRGVGTLSVPIGSGQPGTGGGVFHGPQGHDRGDWGIIWGS